MSTAKDLALAALLRTPDFGRLAVPTPPGLIAEPIARVWRVSHGHQPHTWAAVRCTEVLDFRSNKRVSARCKALFQPTKNDAWRTHGG